MVGLEDLQTPKNLRIRLLLPGRTTGGLVGQCELCVMLAGPLRVQVERVLLRGQCVHLSPLPLPSPRTLSGPQPLQTLIPVSSRL